MGSIDTSDATNEAHLRQPNIFGQMVFDSYTIVTLGFALDDARRDQALSSLDNASLRLMQAFPFVSGEVVCEGRNKTSSGVYKIVPYPPHTGKTVVRRKDCTALLPPYIEIRAAKAPFSKLDGDIISPMPGFGAAITPGSACPVFIIQANLVTGGLLLTFSCHHNALDMNGQGVLTRYFSMACNGQQFDPLDMKIGNETPQQAPLESGEKSVDLSDMLRPSQLSAGPPPSLPPYVWTYWRCPGHALAQLKSSSGAYSSNDALAAFYSHCLATARIALGVIAPNDHFRVNRAANCRKAMGHTDRHMGHAVAVADTTVVPTDDMKTLVKALREKLGTVDGNYVRSLISAILETEDKTTIFYGAKHRPGTDILLSSWAHHPFYELEFGMLGKPDFCRRPRMGIVPDLAYFMPKNREGDIDIAACLRPVEVEALGKVEEWTRVMEYIG